MGDMRMRRLSVKGADAAYHCMSRTVNGSIYFKDREKEVFRKMLWRVADFSGVELLTYSIMGNHFHVLVRVPHVDSVSDAELIRRYRVLYPNPTKYETASIRVMEAELKANGEAAETIRSRLMARMHNVSMFMKTLKQRFSIWYNKNNDRFGPLWSDRFKSVLVEGRDFSLQTMAAYIDLNAVRGGLVEDPKDYRFCGYAEAVAGNDLAKSGLESVVGCVSALESYRTLLYGKGALPGVNGGAGLPEAAVSKVLTEQQGALSTAAVLRCRARYFTDGAVFGTAEFVRGFVNEVQRNRYRKRPPAIYSLKEDGLGQVAVIGGAGLAGTIR